MTTLGFVGLGAMGSRMARRLLDAGHELVVWNRTRDKAEELARAGALVAENPADAARRAEVVMTMLADPQALEAVVKGDDGIAAGADASTVIEMSTVGPAAIEWLRQVLPAEFPLLDAPVLGSLSEDDAGSLKVFVRGDAELAQRWMPLLETFGTTFHVGPLGSGAAAKLVANTALLGTLTLLGEALALSEGLGLSRDAAFQVLSVSPLAPQAERRRQSIEDDDYPLRFTLALAFKDSNLIGEAAASAGVDMRLMSAACSWFEEVVETGGGDQDYSAILAHILKRN